MMTLFPLPKYQEKMILTVMIYLKNLSTYLQLWVIFKHTVRSSIWTSEAKFFFLQYFWRQLELMGFNEDIYTQWTLPEKSVAAFQVQNVSHLGTLLDESGWLWGQTWSWIWTSHNPKTGKKWVFIAFLSSVLFSAACFPHFSSKCLKWNI